MSQVHRHLPDQTYKVFSFHEFVNIAICLAPHPQARSPFDLHEL